jgi:hypothetical protein
LEGKSSSSTFLTRKNNKRKKARDKIITLKTQKLRARFRFWFFLAIISSTLYHLFDSVIAVVVLVWRKKKIPEIVSLSSQTTFWFFTVAKKSTFCTNKKRVDHVQSQ